MTYDLARLAALGEHPTDPKYSGFCACCGNDVFGADHRARPCAGCGVAICETCPRAHRCECGRIFCETCAPPIDGLHLCPACLIIHLTECAQLAAMREMAPVVERITATPNVAEKQLVAVNWAIEKILGERG